MDVKVLKDKNGKVLSPRMKAFWVEKLISGGFFVESQREKLMDTKIQEIREMCHQRNITKDGDKVSIDEEQEQSEPEQQSEEEEDTFIEDLEPKKRASSSKTSKGKSKAEVDSPKSRRRNIIETQRSRDFLAQVPSLDIPVQEVEGLTVRVRKLHIIYEEIELQHASQT